jgi:O-antigen/teichoic acid export membrane protein
MIPHFLRNLGLLTAAQVLARARGIILLPILSRYLGTAEFGVWAQVSIVVFTLSPLVMLGTENGLIRLLPGLAHETQRRRFTAWLICCAGSAAIVAGSMVLWRREVAIAFLGSAGEFQHFIPLAAASVFAAILFVAARLWFVIRNDGAVMAGAVVVQAGCGLVAVFAAIAMGGGVFEMVAYGVVGDMAAALGLLALAAAQGAFGKPDFTILGPAIRFGLPFVPAGYAMWGLNWIDRLFLVQYRDVADIGIYTAAYSIGYAVIQLFTTPIWAIYPSTAALLHARSDRHNLDRLVHGTIGTVLFVGVPAVAGLWLLGPPIVALIAGPGYEAGAAVVPLIALAYLFHMLASFAEVSLGLAYRQYLAALSLVVAASVNLALNFFLIPAFGIVGAAEATLAGFVCQFVYSWGFALWSGPFWRDIRVPAKVFLATACMAAGVFVLDRLMTGTSAVRLAALVPFGIGLYFLVALILGIAPQAVTGPVYARLSSYLKARTR